MQRAGSGGALRVLNLQSLLGSPLRLLHFVLQTWIRLAGRANGLRCRASRSKRRVGTHGPQRPNFPATRPAKRHPAHERTRLFSYTTAFPADRYRAQEGSLHRSIACTLPSPLHHHVVTRLPCVATILALTCGGKHATPAPSLPQYTTQQITLRHAVNINTLSPPPAILSPPGPSITRPCMEHHRTSAVAC